MSPADFPPHPIDIDLHPPAGGRVIATFTYPDHEVKSAELESEIVDVKSEIGDVSNEISELRVEITSVKSDVAAIRDEVTGVREDVTGVREEVSGIREEVSAVRSEGSVVRDEIAAVRSESGLPRAELQDLRDLISNFGGVIRDLRDDLGGIRKEIVTVRQEVRDVAVELRVQKKTAATVAWATGATMALAFLLLLVLGWNMRNNINEQLRTALNSQQRAADSTARTLDAAKDTLQGQIAASRELYLLTVRELDRFGSLNPQLQNRLIATLPVNAAFSGDNEPELGAHVTERDHDVIALLRPTPAERISTRRPIEAVVRLNRTASEVAALLIAVRRSGSEVLSCHSYFKPVDGLNKLQCPALEAGKYDLTVTGFLTEDATKNPRPGYTVGAVIQVDEAPVRNASLQ